LTPLSLVSYFSLLVLNRFIIQFAVCALNQQIYETGRNHNKTREAGRLNSWRQQFLDEHEERDSEYPH
jgi:hypothetical protein